MHHWLIANLCANPPNRSIKGNAMQFKNDKDDSRPLMMKPGMFDRVASAISRFAGLPITFFMALLTVVVWAVTGPVFDYSEVWQLVINTGTTIITFLLLFVVQSTQNRDTAALQLKLDAIIYVLTGCDNDLINAEDLTLKELEEKVAEFKEKANKSSPAERSDRFNHLTSKSRKQTKSRKSKPRKELP